MPDFESLYSQHLQAVYRYALRCVGRRDIAEEIAAEAFLALYRHRDRMHAGWLPGWLLTVVRNRAVDYWRHVQREQRTAPGREEQVGGPAMHASGNPSALDAWLLERCKDLKPLHRACLTLRFAHGMRRAEIACELSLTENQVKSALQYALELLRKSLSESRSSPSRLEDAARRAPVRRRHDSLRRRPFNDRPASTSAQR